MKTRKIAGLAGLAIYIGAAGWSFMVTPEPSGLLPGIAWQWIIRSHQIERVGFYCALMPLWCLIIHRLLHHKMPDITSFLRTYSVITAPCLITAVYLACQLQTPDCLRTCPDDVQMNLIWGWFCLSVATAILLSVRARLKA